MNNLIGINLFVCQDMSKSKEQQKYFNYTRLPAPRPCQLDYNN